jgi:retron-type reverse transcriptase
MTPPATGEARTSLWDRLTSWENLLEAARKAERGKRLRGDVAQFNSRREQELLRLREELRRELYRPGGYRRFRIREGKPRLISAAPYRDRVVHHALCSVLEPIWEKRFIRDSYACRPGKGTHAAADRYQQFSRRARYVLQCDIRRYFDSIDHAILWNQIGRHVRDEAVRRLVGTILATHGSLGWLWPAGRGLPLGNQTSQFFANVYLDPFDHWIKEELRRRFYVRYVDDFAVLGQTRRELWDVAERAQERLGALGLRLHARKCRVFPVGEGCDFVGYRIWPTHRRLGRHSGYRFRRRYRRLIRAIYDGRLRSGAARAHVAAWIGHARHADTWGLRQAILGAGTSGGP